MKNLFKINLAMMLALFLISSCGKKDAVDSKDKEITSEEMQNNSNLYDEQGTSYNGFLNAIAAYNDGGITADDDWEAPKSITGIGGWDVSKIAAFNGDIGGWDVGQITTNNDIGGWDVGQIISFAMYYNSKNGKESGEEAQANLAMQLEAFSGLGTYSPIDDCLWRPDRCRRFQLALAALEPSNGGSAHDRTLKFINMIRDQEKEIQGDTELSNDEKKAVLISYSLARHAAGYWYNQAPKNDKVVVKMIQLSTLGASTALTAAGSENVGLSDAILGAYIATGRAN